MISEFEITYYGHSCFGIVSDGYSAVFDPYKDEYVPGLSPIRLEANAVFCSHGHGDHCFGAGVKLLPTAALAAVETHDCPHDDAQGALRGSSTIHILHLGEFKIVHMGDVGDMPIPEQMERIYGADVMLIPVGGYYTVDASMANEIVKKAKPRVVIPMHYRTETSGFPVLTTVDGFAQMQQNVLQCGSSVTISGDTEACTMILTQKNA